MALLALLFVGPALMPGRALLPVDNLFLYPPWRAYASAFGVTTPHNPLIGDAILQNYSWKRFAATSFAAGQLPLWNPYILAGEPFLAAAQNGALYPLGALFYILPLGAAYGWFIALHLWLGALFSYRLARALGATQLGGLVAGITFGFCGYLVVSFVWPMVVSTAVWLPALLLVVERLIQSTERARPAAACAADRAPIEPGSVDTGGAPARRPDPLALVAVGAVVVALQFLAGHLEMSLYLLLTAGLYTAFRMIGRFPSGRIGRSLGSGLFALGAVGLGTGLAAVLLIPFVEAIGSNVRTGWSDYEETVGYALPRERLIAFLIPDLFGNPTHRSYLDLEDGQTYSVEHVRPNGEARIDTEWGGKNYVEGTVYVGVLTLLLAFIGLLRRPPAGARALAAIGLIAILFAFGTPLYAVLFYGIPGVNQLHTPFRWVYPLSLCLAVLAGLGASALDRAEPRRLDRWMGRVGLSAAVTGALLTAGLLAVLLTPETGLSIAARALRRWPDLRGGFDDPRVLFSYQYLQLLGATALIATSGLAIWTLSRHRGRLARLAILGLLVGDLFTFGAGFNTAADTSPLTLVPPSIRAIQADPGLFRIVTYGEDDTLPSNTNMLFGLQDIRGYDTIIARDYVEYLELLEPQRGVPYSKVAKLFDQRSLASPLLDQLNVKYVLTTRTIALPGYTLIHDGIPNGDGVRVYRNEHALPRAFLVDGATPAVDRPTALRLVSDPGFDPARTVVVEGWSGDPRPASGRARAAEVLEYGASRVILRASTPSRAFLVLADAFYPGWTATVSGQAAPLFRANGVLRAVELPPGDHTVVIEYRPWSLRLGAFVSVAAVGVLALIVALAVWRRIRVMLEPTNTAQRVLKNSAFPMAAGLLNKLLDVAFALVMFRVLRAEGVGAYTFAGVLVGYFDILIGFGLSTLITRDVARDRDAARAYFGNALALRLALWCAAAGIVAVLVGPGASALDISPPLALTIWLLLLGLLPGIVSSTLSALFMANEQMEHPAVATVITTLLKISLGLVALLLGWGYVGLASVSVATNTLTAVLLLVMYTRTLPWPGLRVGLDPCRRMLVDAFPLMINSLLNTIFFRIDAVLLKPLAGDAALGWYSTAYKFIDGLQVVPASFVPAVFPLLSRRAAGDRLGLASAVAIALKGLLIVALPITVGTTLLAEPIILLFAGPGFLPESAIALQVLIWFLPISFVNGLVQYVLIAVNRQRWITMSFGVVAAFNVALNVALIPRFGYLAASAITVLSELILLVPFWIAMRRELPPIGLPGLAGRPFLAALVMAGPVWLLRDWSVPLAILGGALVYAVALIALRAISPAERAVLRRLVQRTAEPAIVAP